MPLDDPYEGASQQYGVDANLLRALTTVESNNNDQAVSPQGAVGRAQFLPSTAREMDIDPTNPREAVYGAAKYLRQNFDQFGGRPDLAIAAYHGGPNTDQWGPKTRDYVDKIVDRYTQLKGSAAPVAAGPEQSESYIDNGQWDQPESSAQDKKTLTIGQVREQYPQYKDLSDDQLAKGLHKKYYSDMPFEQFAAKIGIAPPQPLPEQEKVPPASSLPLAQRDEGALPTRTIANGIPTGNEVPQTDADIPDSGLGRVAKAGMGAFKEAVQGGMHPLTPLAEQKLAEMEQQGGWHAIAARAAHYGALDAGVVLSLPGAIFSGGLKSIDQAGKEIGVPGLGPAIGAFMEAFPQESMGMRGVLERPIARGAPRPLEENRPARTPAGPQEASPPGSEAPAVQPGSPEIPAPGSGAPSAATDRTRGGNPASPASVPTMTIRRNTPMLDRLGEAAKGDLEKPTEPVPGTEPKTPGSSAPESPAPVPLAEKPNTEAPVPGERPAPNEQRTEAPVSAEEIAEKPQTEAGLTTSTKPKELTPPSPPSRLRTIQQIQDEDGVGPKKAAATQMAEIEAMGRPITDEERQARAAGVQLKPPPTPAVTAPAPKAGPFEPVPKEPQRLVNFLRAPWKDELGVEHSGGIRDDGGDIRSIIGGNKGRPGLISSRGDNLDNATQRAWHAGFLPEFNDRPMINDLLEKIDHDHNMQPVYSMHDEDAATAYRSAMDRNDELDRLAQEHGIDTKGRTRTQFFDNLSEKLSLDDAAHEMQSQADAHDTAYREAEREAHAWAQQQTGQPVNLKELYGQNQARSLADLENEHREIEAAETTPAGEQRAAGAEQSGHAGSNQAQVPDGTEPRRSGPGAGRGDAEKDAEWKALLARGAKVKADATAYAEAGLPAKFKDRWGTTHLVSKDLNYPPDGWRVTQFGKDGQPSGHYEANSAYDAFREVLESQPERIGPNHLPDAKPADLLGRPIAEKPSARAAEPTIRNDPDQVTMPGMEPSARQAQAARDAAGPRTDQKLPDEGLFERPQTPQPGLKLYAGPMAIFDPDAWRWLAEPLKKPMQKLAVSLGNVAHSVAMGLVPMREGSVRAQAFASDFANSLRQVKFHFDTIDKEITRNFKPAEREQMARAMDAQSVFEQQFRDMNPADQAAARQAFDDGRTGVVGLTDPQRHVVEMLDTISQATWQQMQARGMVDPKARGLPYYFPRQILNWTEEEGFSHVGAGQGGGGAGLDQRGRNLTTQGPMRREHLTPEETEAAAKAKLGAQATLLRDIRSLPSRLAYAQRSITGVDLMSQIEHVGDATGVNLVVRGDIPGLLQPGDYFTIADHPSFRQFTGAGWKAIHVAREFEGPLRAVLTQAAPTWYKAAANMKGVVMSTIMYSPFIHLAVELGRALPADPIGVLTMRALRDGSTMRRNLDFMDQATKDGLAPLGGRWAADPVSIADQANVDGRNRFAAALGNMRDAAANVAGKSPVAGQFLHDVVQHPHQTLLWDQVFNLQVGLYNQLRKNWIDKGYAPDVAGTMAAHIANRYAGALPAEALSRAGNIAANLLLFSRSFTLGNLGVMKDMFNGAPSNVRSRITQMASPEIAKSAQSSMRRKAISAVVMDIGMFYMGNALLQTGLQAMRQGTDKTEQDLMAGAQSALHELSQGNLLGAFNVLPQHWNEPGKQDRVYAGTDSSGRGVYLRLPPGKVGEEFLGWAAKPGPQLLAKLSPLVRPIVEAALGYDTLGRPIYQPNPQGVTDNARIAGQVVKHIVEGLGPTSTIEGIHEMWQHHVEGVKTKTDPGLAALKVLGPLTGLAQISSGYPGGPAAGEMHAETERERYQQQQAMPAIRQKILNGDREGAMKDMTDLKIAPGLQAYYLRQTLNPGITPKQNQQFQRNAPADVKQRVEMQRGQQ